MKRAAHAVPAWARSVGAAVAYALFAFLIGFAFGTIRVLAVAPYTGETGAVLLEAPVMLLVSWKICRWCTRSFVVPGGFPARALMGVVAFTVLTGMELGVSALLLGRSVSEYLLAYGSPAGALGLAAQLCFAGFPILQPRQA